MIFFLLIIFPFLIPVANFIGLRMIFSFPEQWYWILTVLIALDFIYFLLLYLKNKSKLKFLSAAFVSSSIFIALGFFLIMILVDGAAIALFSILWPIILLIFLYAVLHYSYETIKTKFVEIKNIIPYLNVAAFFALVAILMNVNIFLAQPWWMVLPMFVVGAFALNLPFVFLYESNWKISLFYGGIVTLIMAEIMVALFALPIGFYVSGAVAALVYYLLIILLKKKFEGKLLKSDIIKHSVFIGVLLLIILATSQWT